MPTVTLAPWSDEHLFLLVEANTPAMTRYLGGPESESDLQDRHRRYLRAWNDVSAWMYAIVVDDEPAGGIGFWPIDHDGEPAYETGWNVLPRWQGKGVARQALLTLISKVPHEAPPRKRLFAYPSIENGASNGLCRSVGFIDLGERSFSFRDTVLRTRAWAFELDNQG